MIITAPSCGHALINSYFINLIVVALPSRVVCVVLSLRDYCINYVHCVRSGQRRLCEWPRQFLLCLWEIYTVWPAEEHWYQIKNSLQILFPVEIWRSREKVRHFIYTTQYVKHSIWMGDGGKGILIYKWYKVSQPIISLIVTLVWAIFVISQRKI